MRALISVSDKTGVVEFAKALQDMGVEIISTGGTHKKLEEAGIKVTGISDITGFPECLNGRVKTLHPKVHGGILASRDLPEHMDQIGALGVETIDIVAVNLYPFKETIMKSAVTMEDAIENIDIGGPAMLRSSAKNHKDVTVICDPSDYDQVIAALKDGGTTYEMRYGLALKVFQQTAAYDAMIAEYLAKESGQGETGFPDRVTMTYEKIQDLRYGENPHQKAAYYREVRPRDGVLTRAVQLHGKELSFNNINDTNGALETLKEFQEPAVVAVKHANPCGVAVADSLVCAYKKAHDCDPVSIFGGIVACNRPVDKETAEEMNKIFIEIVIAPDFHDDALAVLQQKADIRLLKLPDILTPVHGGDLDIKRVTGGILLQDSDSKLFDVENAFKPDQPATDTTESDREASAFGKPVYDGKFMVVTDKEPEESQLRDLEIAMKVVKHTKSNAIVFVKDGMTIAIGPGQTNRIWAVENGIKRCLFDMKGAVMASDAFFPFDDCVTAAAEAGVTAIIQPGGSVRDGESIAKADQLGIAMMFSGLRHFKH